MSADLDLFHVSMKDGTVRAMNADQIDEAFHAGLIDASSGVVRAGDLHWTTLGELAGLDDVTPSPHSVAPVAMDPSDEVPAFRPKRGRAVAGFVVAIAAIGAIGYAGTRARPGFVTAKFRALTHHVNEAPKAAAVVVAPPPAAPLPPPPAPVKVDPPKPAPSASVAPAVPAFSPHDLPPAKAKKRR